MFLKDKQTQDLIEIKELDDLINPTHDHVEGQVQAGQNEQPTSTFSKQDLIFPSGENLPRCWLDADYRLKAAPN